MSTRAPRQRTRPVTSSFLLVLALGASGLAATARGDDAGPIECVKDPPPPPKIKRSEVYASSPFKAGEIARYEVNYSGIMVGYGDIETRDPIMVGGIWHRVFHAVGRTGDWYKNIFVADDVVSAVSRPWDFGVARFYMKQDEGRIFAEPYRREKWLEFDHVGCVVKERVQIPGKPEEKTEIPMSTGSIDVLGAVFKLRSIEYKIGQVERFRVYTSEKNWWLEATPEALEAVEVPAGKYQAHRIKLQTYIGQDLQQKGDVRLWISTAKERHLVKIQGEIKIGSVNFVLNQFTPGHPY